MGLLDAGGPPRDCSGAHGSKADFMDHIKAAIRTIPDHPKPGIMFRDVTTLLGDASAFRAAVDAMVFPHAGKKIDKVAGIEARGFILGGAVAHQLSVGFVPVRKKGKLPDDTLSQTYELEYGTDEIEIHVDAIRPGETVLIVDDLIATGGTAEAAVKLLRAAGAEVVGASFVIDLPDLGGARRLEARGVKTTSLVAFEGE
jgi:adenine phosphoribosyltransferase